jgi:hypothetical protein
MFGGPVLEVGQRRPTARQGGASGTAAWLQRRSRRVVLKTITADHLRPLAGMSRLRALGLSTGAPKRQITFS